MDEKKLSVIFERSKKNFDLVFSALREERELCHDDRRFYSIAGAQWEGKYQSQFENKPQPEINKVHKSIIDIVGEYRNNPVTVEFIPADGSEDNLTDTLNGLYRADEKDSHSSEAYDNAFEEAVSGGFGAWRLTAQYEDESDDENEFQRIKIEPIFEADRSVFFDLDSKLQDKSDATMCWVITSLSHDKYKKLYNDNPESWDVDLSSDTFDWYTPEVVFVSEYYEVEEYKSTIQIWSDITGQEIRYSDNDFKDDPKLEKNLLDSGSSLTRTKKVTKKRVHKYILSGGGILEDLGYIPGSVIPIVPVYGKRWFIDDIERCMGHVRLSKDPQRIKNMQTSKLMEISSLSSVEKPYFTPEQVINHTSMHTDDNIVNYPFLLVDPIRDQNGNEIATGPLGYKKVPSIPPALTGLIQLCDQDIKEISGVSQSAEEMFSNLSGKAVAAIQNRIDKKTYIYISNFSKAMKRTGEIWLSMARDLYVENSRVMKTIGIQKEIGNVKINKPVFDDEKQKIVLENDISGSNMGVNVIIGPTSDSRRDQTVSNITEILPYVSDQQTKDVLSHLIISNMDGEGLQDVRKWSREKLLFSGVIDPTEDELLKLQEKLKQNSKPDANEILLQSAALEAQAKAKKAEADALKSYAEVEEIKVDTEKTRAETLEIMSDMNRKDFVMVRSNLPPAQK